MLDRENFFLDTFTQDLGDETIKEITETVEGAVQCVSAVPPMSILTFSCGGFAYAKALEKKGFKVSIWDFFGYLPVAKTLFANSNIHLLGPGIDAIGYGNDFNLIFGLSYSFGLSKEQDGEKKILSSFYSSLLPGGKLLLQIIGRDLLEKYFQPKYWVEEKEKFYLLNERSLNFESGWLQENYILIRGGEVRKYQLGSKLFYPEEIKSLLETYGFKNIKIYGDFNKKEYNDKAHYMLVIAEKPMLNSFIKC